jgi:hypothetical protein
MKRLLFWALIYMNLCYLNTTGGMESANGNEQSVIAYIYYKEGRMKDLLDPQDNRKIIERIGKLLPSAQAQWGTMHVAQMLAHTQMPLRCAFGEVKYKRSLLGIFVGRIALKKLTSGEPWKHSMPTNTGFVVADEREFEKEKKQLVSLVKRFTQSGPSAITKEAHPFFGKMNPQEWSSLQWNHLNHHLTQFGV